MKLEFLGTKGYVEKQTRRHRMHSTMKASYYHTCVVIDFGEDWKGHEDDINADALFVTHAHPDHAWGLKNGINRPVYATAESREKMGNFNIETLITVEPGKPVDVGKMKITAFSVMHSTRAPAVGYRIDAGRRSVFYVPDVVWINERRKAMDNINIYIGDGATVKRSMVRKPGDTLIGHVPIRTQLTWCKKMKVPRAVFTHCGSKIVDGDERKLGAEIRRMAEERNVKAEIARDGMEIVLR